MRRFLFILLVALVGCSQPPQPSVAPRASSGSDTMVYATTITHSTVSPALTVGRINPIDTSGGTVSLSYPAPSTWSGRYIIVKDAGADFDGNNLTITQQGSEKLGGVAASYVANLRGSVFQLVSDGTNVDVYGTGQMLHPVVNISGLFSSNIYTLQLSDVGKILDCATNTNSTVKVPTNASVAFPIGSDAITVINSGTGVITLVATTPATTTLNSNVAGTFGVQTTRIGVSTNTSNQGIGVQLKKTGTDTWYAIGPTY